MKTIYMIIRLFRGVLHSGDFELNVINPTERLERSRDDNALKFASNGIFLNVLILRVRRVI